MERAPATKILFYKVWTKRQLEPSSWSPPRRCPTGALTASTEAQAGSQVRRELAQGEGRERPQADICSSSRSKPPIAPSDPGPQEGAQGGDGVGRACSGGEGTGAVPPCALYQGSPPPC